MIDLQKDYHTLKELRAQLQEAIDQLQTGRNLVLRSLR